MTISTYFAKIYVRARAAKNEKLMRDSYECILDWLAHEYAQEGNSPQEIDAMDLPDMAKMLIARAAER